MLTADQREQCVYLIRKFEATLPTDQGRIDILNRLPDDDLSLLARHIQKSNRASLTLGLAGYGSILAAGGSVFVSTSAAAIFAAAAGVSAVGLYAERWKSQRIHEAIRAAVDFNLR